MLVAQGPADLPLVIANLRRDLRFPNEVVDRCCILAETNALPMRHGGSAFL
jgi:hypothetical protein